MEDAVEDLVLENIIKIRERLAHTLPLFNLFNIQTPFLQFCSLKAVYC